jgi:hypothetical protein
MTTVKLEEPHTEAQAVSNKYSNAHHLDYLMRLVSILVSWPGTVFNLEQAVAGGARIAV